jgi:Photosynthetic reaction centre cytochrome C subunit
MGISSFVIPPENTASYKNLKVLSRDISEEEMDRVMHSFNSELGVTCIYCHVTDRSEAIPRADFVSDAKPEKNIARKMLKMTFKLNRCYFGSSVDGKLQIPVKVWCATCHRGLPKPVWKIE